MNKIANHRDRGAARPLMSKDTDIVHSLAAGIARKRLASGRQISMLQPETALAARRTAMSGPAGGQNPGKQL